MKETQDLHALFTPKAIAVVGASEEEGKIGSGLVESLRQSYPGEVYYINPRYQSLYGQPCYPGVQSLPRPVSHAIIAVARDFVPDILEACIAAGIKNIVVISSGFKEADARGAELEAALARRCREEKVNLLGPNTLGFINSHLPFNGTFLPQLFPPGSISVISQSGGVGMALLSSMKELHCAPAKWVGVGNEAVISAVSLLAYLAEDAQTKAIAVCFESLQNLPGFLALAGQVNQSKPVVLLRDGKSGTGIQAAVSHTGAMAQSPRILEDIIEQYGLLEANSCQECAVMLKALSLAECPRGNRVSILSNTAGPAILAADMLEPAGVSLPQPSPRLTAEMDAALGLPLGLKNPADISSAGLQPARYGTAAKGLLQADEYDAMLGFFSLNPHLLLPDAELAAARQAAGKPVVGCFLCDCFAFAAYGREIEKQGIPCFCDPLHAATAMAALVRQGQNQRRERAEKWTLNQAQRQAIEACLAPYRGQNALLSQADSLRLLQAAGLRVSGAQVAKTAGEAAQAAGAMGYPVVLKVDSCRIPHKSDVGGVQLNIKNEAELKRVYAEMHPAMRKLDPAAEISVQPMLPPGFEMILGAVRLPALGPVVMAGSGGVYAEIFEDNAFALAPLSEAEAARLLKKLKCSRVLAGFRGKPLAGGAVRESLCRLAALLEAFPCIREVDCNPLRVYDDRAVGLDARIVVNEE